MLAGTVAAALLLLKFTNTPLAPAAAESVTVPVAAAPPITGFGDTVNPVIVPLFENPLTDTSRRASERPGPLARMIVEPFFNPVTPTFTAAVFAGIVTEDGTLTTPGVLSLSVTTTLAC